VFTNNIKRFQIQLFNLKQKKTLLFNVKTPQKHAFLLHFLSKSTKICTFSPKKHIKKWQKYEFHPKLYRS
jgi:hypothetical protein